MIDATAVSAVIVNHNSRKYALSCLSSLSKTDIGQVVLVDNGSSDDSVEVIKSAFPNVALIEESNRGFGAGVNAGTAQVTGEWLLILNADTVVEPEAIVTLLRAFDGAPTLGAVGPRIENSDGTLYPSARTFPSMRDSIGHGFLGLIWKTNPFSRRYKMLDWDHGDERSVDWISGAAMLVRRSAFEEVGGFDEGYFMYMEDVDFCWRLGECGWSIKYIPSATIEHVQGVSTDQAPYRMIIEHHKSLFRYSRRTASPDRRFLLPVVGAGLGVRAALACAQRVLNGKRPRKRQTAG